MDPDYEIAEAVKLQAREREEKEINETVEKVRAVITTEFKRELDLREAQLEQIQNRIAQTSKTLHLLRYALVTAYYNRPDIQQSAQDDEFQTGDKQSRIHPAIKKLIGQNVTFTPETTIRKSRRNNIFNVVKEKTRDETEEESMVVDEVESDEEDNIVPIRNREMIKQRVIVGNISKCIKSESREDNSTHKWMVYVRGPKNKPNIDDFVKKVVFYLHPSYKPNDVIEVKDSPFHLSRRGWGEFPLRVQLFFHSSLNKPVDVVHNLKLDRTYTGKQTLGNETVVDLKIYSGKTLEYQTEDEILSVIKSEPIEDIDLSTIKIELEETVIQMDEPMIESEECLYTHREEIDINTAPILEEVITEKEPSYSIFEHNYALTEGQIKKEKLKRHLPQDFITNLGTKRLKLENGTEGISLLKINYEKYKVNLPSHCFNSVLETLPYLLKRLPLITPLAKELSYKCTYPYSANSFEEYASWPVEKRMSAEWARSKKVQKIIENSTLREKNWPTKRILMYARAHGYTPMSNYKMFKHKTYDFASTTEPSPITVLSDNNDFIDILDCNTEETNSKPKINLRHTQCDDLSSFVKQTSLDVGVVLQPEEIVPGVEYNAAHRVLLESSKCFVENLIRNARALLVYKDGFSEDNSEITPEEIKTVLNTHRPEFKKILSFNKDLFKY